MMVDNAEHPSARVAVTGSINSVNVNLNDSNVADHY